MWEMRSVRREYRKRRECTHFERRECTHFKRREWTRERHEGIPERHYCIYS